MLYVHLQNLGFQYEQQDSPLLKDISVSLDSYQRIGLIGKNGCGKTTLIRLIRGELSLTDGTIYRKDGLNIGYLPQQTPLGRETTVEEYLWSARPCLADVKRRMGRYLAGLTDDYTSVVEYQEAGGYRFEVTVEQGINRFGFSREFLRTSLNALSSGERTRIGLTRVLLTDPDLLIMDEPTNHLDLDALQWLEAFVPKCSLPFVIISHDRHFLDMCCTTIWEIENGELTTYSGNYTWYRDYKKKEQERMMAEYEKQKKKIRQLKAAAAKRKSWAFSHQPQTGPNGYAPIFESIHNEAKQAMVQAKSIEKRIELAVQREEAKKPVIEKKRKISFAERDLRNRIILKVDGLGKDYDGCEVFRGLSFSVSNGARLAVAGKNGCGKTTLLDIIAGRSADYSGSYRWVPQAVVGYFSQEHEALDLSRSVLDNMPGGGTGDQTRARSLLGSLNIRGDTVFRKLAELSLGQRSKAAVAALILSETNVLVLDEPTNHLEISAREAIEEALLAYCGTVLFVSHDRYFTRKLATCVLDLETGIFRECCLAGQG